MKAPMPCELPIPRPPPSLRWISTTPISAIVTKTWITIKIANIGGGVLEFGKSPGGSAPWTPAKGIALGTQSVWFGVKGAGQDLASRPALPGALHTQPPDGVRGTA